jgi:hypothetical protein
MPNRSRARRATRQALLSATSVSRKLTGSSSSRSSKAKKRGKNDAVAAKVGAAAHAKKKELKSTPWLRPEESIELKAADWQCWIATPPEARNVIWAMEAIYWAEQSGAQAVPDAFSELTKVAEDAAAISIDSTPLLHQLLRGELHVKLGVATNDASMSQAGVLSIIQGLDVLLDGEGVPHKKYLGDFPALVSCWLRSLCLAKRKDLEWPLLNQQQTEAWGQCKHLALRLAQLSRINGERIFGNRDDDKIDATLIKGSLKFWGDKPDRRNAASLRTDIIKPSPKAAVEKIARAVCNDWSGVAIFRSEPKPDAAYIGVAYDTVDFEMEFGVKGLPLASGEARLSLTRDGHALVPTGPWEEVCRHQEPEVEYWELERTHDRGVWIQRQIALICKDRLAYVCDNIVADGSGKLTYELTVPLAPGIQAIGAEETREMVLSSGKMPSVILPLAAEEWRSTPSHFDFRAIEGRLLFTGATRGQRMSIPWLIDLRGNRKVDELTWRQLRVGENLQNLPPDIAVAFRWQLGRDQWMAYRSLAAPSNRTVLGQNLIGDFLLARLLPTGKIKNIVEIE